MKQHMECDAVIFDLDGVLIDSTAVVKRHWQRWALKHDFDPEEIMCMAHGRRTVETIFLLAPHLDVMAEAASLVAGEAFDTDGLVRIDGAVELVSTLPKEAWAVATSGTRDTAITRLVYAGLSEPAVLITADDVERGKPDPQAFLLAAERLHAAAQDCIVVEDSPAGVEAAHAAGMRVIAVATTHSQQELQSADVFVDRLCKIQASTRGEPSNPSRRHSRRLTLTVR
jgi:sugar-phosphatase